MAYNRWLAHHGVKDQKWGVKNGPPYPLDRSISDGHRLIKSDGSPQGKKKYKTSEKTAHKRAERKARTNRELDRARKLYGKDDISEAEMNALRRAKKDIESHHVISPELQELITMDQMDHADVENYSVWDEIFEGHVGASLKPTKTVFVSGSSKTQDEASGYYRKELPKDIQKQLDSHMSKGNRIIVGDAPGIDRQVQDYLNAKKYKNVEVYGPGKQVRYSANSNWKTNPIDDPDHEPGSKEWLAKKDIAMTEAADEGLAIVLDEGAKATRKNVQRLSDSGKSVKVYSLNQDGSDGWEDDWDRKWNTSYASKDVKKANDIYKTLSKQEKYFLTAEENSKRYVSREEYGKKGTNVYSVIEQYKDTPVSVIDIWKNDRGGADVSIAVRNDSNYRHKGYASRALENGIKYFYDHPELEYLIWGVNSKNRPSIELAKKYGFYLYDKRDDGWETYTLDQKKEVKHAMYNRWLESDHLEHHGVKDQEWGKRNGPPYPLYRQEKFRTVGPDGRPITSKVAYKKAQKNVRAANRAERKANPNGTPQDKEERNSFGAQIKRKYREHKRKQKELEAARDEYEQKTEKDWKEATDRLKSLNLPEDVANRLEDSSYIRTHGIQGQSWGPRPGSKTQGERLNEAIDKYLSDQKAARDAAKEHGTAEEVMKYRDTFSKDEWNEIAGRLEAEARVKKLLDRPLDSANNNQNQSKKQNQNSFQESSTTNSDGGFSDLKGKIKKIAEKGDARDVYKNRTKFTPEQLQTISRRLQAEETIAKYADNQLLFKSDALRNLESIARYAQTAGNIATGVSTIVKAFGGNSGGNNGGGGKKNKIKGAKGSDGSITKNAHLIEEIQKKAEEASNKAKNKGKKFKAKANQ